jgi:uncharacterized protein
MAKVRCSITSRAATGLYVCPPTHAIPTPSRTNAAAGFGGGALIGALGGLIGLGGAEFRLPLLIGAFRFPALEAIIINKAISLVVVASALLFRTKAIPVSMMTSHYAVVVNLLLGSLLGAWLGASWATRLHSRTLYRLIALLLVSIALVLAGGHAWVASEGSEVTGVLLWMAGVLVGFAIEWSHHSWEWRAANC